MDLTTIQKRISQLDAAQQEARRTKETLDDALKEDDRYQEIDLQIRDLALKRKQLKDEIWTQKAFQEAVAKLKDIREEISDLAEILNQELLDWRQKNNTDEIIGADGTTRRVKISVRLLPPRSQPNN